MKSLGIIVVLAIGVLAMLFALVPLGVRTHVQIAPERGETISGNLRIGTITVQNSGIFTHAVRLPQYTACAGDREVAIDAYTGSGANIVHGVGQLPYITVRPGEQGTVSLVTRESDLHETILVYAASHPFSCLTATNPVGSSVPLPTA